MNELLSLEEFVKLLWDTRSSDNSYNSDLAKRFRRVHKYAEFLTKPLNLGWFLPLDSDGEVVPEMKFCGFAKGDKYWVKHKVLLDNAKSNILFDGWEVDKWDDDAIVKGNLKLYIKSWRNLSGVISQVKLVPNERCIKSFKIENLINEN